MDEEVVFNNISNSVVANIATTDIINTKIRVLIFNDENAKYVNCRYNSSFYVGLLTMMKKIKKRKCKKMKNEIIIFEDNDLKLEVNLKIKKQSNC